jgi:meiotically up-regulated gene 157 (Mug157) protein
VHAVEAVIGLVQREQHHDRSSYRLQRPGGPPDGLAEGGRGAPVSYTGMAWSGFRPSDDACVYGFHIPSNAAMAVALRNTAHLLRSVHREASLSGRAESLAARIAEGVTRHGTVADSSGHPMWAYETDGRGHHLRMDDPNVPSLLALPYVGWCSPGDPTYRATRRFVLSRANPWYVGGPHGHGLASPHTPAGWVWPLAWAVQGLTTEDPAERAQCLDLLEGTDGGTGKIHESVDLGDPARFTRGWFSWADMTYAHLVLRDVGLSGPADGTPIGPLNRPW